MEVLVGLHISMGALKFPRVRMYWASRLMLKVVEAMKKVICLVIASSSCVQTGIL